jgi:hypothetical protein
LAALRLHGYIIEYQVVMAETPFPHCSQWNKRWEFVRQRHDPYQPHRILKFPSPTKWGSKGPLERRRCNLQRAFGSIAEDKSIP